MSGPKHTPGPWVSSSSPDDYSVDVEGAQTFVHSAVGPEGKRPVALVVTVGWNDAQHDANVALVRAAPRLAEALKELLDYTLGLELVAYDAVERRYERPEVTAARAALREAGVIDDA